MMAALAVGRARGLSFERWCRRFAPIARSCIASSSSARIGGVDYINDSKATNLDALEKALLSATRPIVLIAGGKDKGFAFDSIAPLVAQQSAAGDS